MTVDGDPFVSFQQEHYALVRGCVPVPLLAALVTASEAAQWTPLPLTDGPVRQRKDEAVIDRPTAMAGLPAVLGLLTAEVMKRDVSPWRPNELVLNRYVGHSAHITSHRDSSRYTGLIAVVTLLGRAHFRISSSRTSLSSHEWQSRPGDLVLFRGAVAGGQDDRPFHSVDGPVDGVRISLSARIDSRL